MQNRVLFNYLENLYSYYQQRKFVSPDPLEFLYKYEETKNYQENIEIMGLVASSLAYGQVKQILKSISKIEKIFKQKPYEYVMSGNINTFTKDLKDFKHRFTKGIDFAKFLEGIRLTLKEYGNLENAFMKFYSAKDTTTHFALNKFYKLLSKASNSDLKNIFPNPEKKSACKRMHLFLRWMIRKDAVDLGVWGNISSSKLIMPLDTHVLDIAEKLGFIDKKQNNIKTAIEVTECFKTINKEDPVKYDFSLTRAGIRNESEEEFLKELENLSRLRNEKKHIGLKVEKIKNNIKDSAVKKKNIIVENTRSDIVNNTQNRVS